MENLRPFRNVTPKGDCVTTYASDDGFYRVIKCPSAPGWEARACSLVNILGEPIGFYPSLESAVYALGGKIIK